MSSLTGNLMIGTGIFHCLVGLVVVPELRDPFLRMLRDGSVESSNNNIQEQYEREAAFWFQVAGIFMIVQGQFINTYIRDCCSTSTRGSSNKKVRVVVHEAPMWFGWTMASFTSVSCYLMPKSGWWLVLAQSVRIIWNNHQLSS